MKQFLKAIYRQLTGTSSPRESKVEIGYWAYKQMRELHLDIATLEDVFRHGRKVTTIVQDYQNYSISIGYRWMRIKSNTLLQVSDYTNERGCKSEQI